MEYQLDMALYNGIFAVPNAIIDDYLKLASGNTLKVLLVLLRHSGNPVSLSTIEQFTGLTTQEVYDALTFWSDLEVLNIGNSSAVFESSISTEISTSQPTSTASTVSQLVSPTPCISDSAVAPPSTPVPQEAPTLPKFQVVSTSFPRPTMSEAAEYVNASEELQFLVSHYRQTFGKDPDSFVCCSLVALYHWCDLSAETLALLISYYSSTGVKSWQRIERNIIQCKERGVDTYEKVDAFILSQSQSHQQEQEIRRIFGLSDRAFTTKEKGYIEQWYGDFHYNSTLITLAYERSTDSIGKLSFPYIHKILETWHGQNIRTIEEAEVEMMQGKAKPSTSAKEKSAAKSTARKYNDTSYDLEELEHQLFHKNLGTD